MGLREAPKVYFLVSKMAGLGGGVVQSQNGKVCGPLISRSAIQSCAIPLISEISKEGWKTQERGKHTTKPFLKTDSLSKDSLLPPRIKGKIGRRWGSNRDPDTHHMVVDTPR